MFGTSTIKHHSKDANPGGTETPYSASQLANAIREDVMTTEADVCSYVINLIAKPMQVCAGTSFSERSKALNVAGAISFHLWSARITGSGKYLALTRR